MADPNGRLAGNKTARGASETKYEKRSGSATTKGQMFETKVSALLFLRGVNSGLDFQLASNVKGAGALDDVVFRVKNPAGAWASYFVQLKHKENDKKTLSRKMLIDQNGQFALPTYYNSYEEIKLAMSAPTTATTTLFDGDIGDSLFVIFTNARPNQDLGDARCAPERIDAFLGSSSGAVFSFDPDAPSGPDKAVADSLKGSSVDGARDFLRRLRIFAAQPCEADFDAVIKEELRVAVGEKLPDIDMDRLCVCFVENVKAWMDTSKNLLHRGSDVFESARDRVLAESFSLIEANANRLDLVFEEAALSPLREVLSGDFPVVCVRSSEQTSRLTSTKLLQALDRSTALFVGSKRFLAHREALMSEWGRGPHSTLIVSVNNRDSVADRRHFQNILAMCGPAAVSKKKLVILAGAKIEVSKSVKCWEDTFRFSSLALSSRESFLKTEIMLQGYHISLAVFLGNRSDDGNGVLSAPSVVGLEEAKPTLSLGTGLADPGQHYVPRGLRTYAMNVVGDYLIREAARMENMTALNMTLPDVVDRFFVSSIPQSLAHVLNTLNRFSDSFPSSHSHQTVFVGETFHLGSTRANFVGVSPDKAIALLLQPLNLGWTLSILQGATDNDVSMLAECYKSKHTFEMSDGKYSYDISSGNHDFLQKHLETIRPSSVMEVRARAVIVAGEPGMGKSTLVTQLAKATKETHPHLWVVLVALNDHVKLFFEGKQADPTAFLLEATKTESPLQRLMLKSALEVTGNVVVILDGYDEIVPRYSKQCCQLLSNLLKTKAKKVWITTRVSVLGELESHLSTTPALLDQFIEEDQICFLKRYWADARDSAAKSGSKPLSDEELDSFIIQVLKMSRFIGGPNDFLGVPLQAQMMAEIFADRVTGPSETLALPETLSLLELLDMLVEKKLEAYVQEKLKINLYDPNYKKHLKDNRATYLAGHMEAALQELQNVSGDLLQKRKPTRVLADFIEQIERGDENTGFIDGATDGKAHFVHRVYAEYFAAKWFAENLSEYAQCIEVATFLTNAEGLSIVSKRLCDLILAQDCPLHTAVLNGDVDRVKSLLEDGADVNARDRGGRSPLHLSATTGFGFKTEPNHVEIIDLLVSSPEVDLNSKDGLLQATPLRYASINNSWLMLDKLLAHNADPKDVTSVINNQIPGLRTQLQNTIDYFLANDLDNTLRVFVDIFPSFCDEPSPCFSTTLTRMGDSLLANASHSGSYRVAKMLVGKGHRVNGPSTGSYPVRYPPLHCAAQQGHLQIAELLVGAKRKEKRKVRSTSGGNRSDVTDFVNSKARFGQTALHLASKHGHADVVAFLIKNGADRASLDHEGSTCLHLTACQDRPDLVRAILAELSVACKSVYVNLGNSKKTTSLHLAAKAGALEIVRTLVGAGAKVLRDRYGQTPLMLAARNGHLDVVEYLVNVQKEDGASRNSCVADWIDWQDKDGWTAVSLAASFGHGSVVALLASRGADTGRTGPLGAKPRDYEDEERELVLGRIQSELLNRFGVKNTKSVAINFKRLGNGETLVRVAATNGLLETATIMRGNSETTNATKIVAPSTHSGWKPVKGFRNVVDYLQNPTGDGRLSDCEIVPESAFSVIQAIRDLASLFQTAPYRDGCCGHASVTECLVNFETTRGFSYHSDWTNYV